MCQMMAVCRKATKHFYERKLFYDWISCEASGTLPGCAVSHCWASSAARHCSAALPNAPLRFLRHWRRSASHTPNPLGGSRLQARPIAKQKAALSDGFFFLVGHQGLYPVVPCRTAARLPPHGTALRHCPMLRFAFSATGGAQLRIPRTRSAGPGFKPAPLQNKKPPFRTAFSFWWGIRDLNSVTITL